MQENYSNLEPQPYDASVTVTSPQTKFVVGMYGSPYGLLIVGWSLSASLWS